LPALRGWGNVVRLALPDRLPPLTGRFLLLSRIIWVVAASLMLLNLLFSHGQQNERLQLNHAFYALGTRTQDWGTAGPYVVPVSAEARRNIPSGEQLVAVDGNPIGFSTHLVGYPNRPELVRRLSGAEGGQTALTMLRPDGTRHTVRLTRRAANEPAVMADGGISADIWVWAAYWIAVAGGLLAFAPATLIMLRRPHDTVAVLLATGLVSEANLSALWPSQPMWVWAILSNLFLFSIVTGMATFPDGRLQPRWRLIPPAIALVLVAMPFIAIDRPALWPIASLLMTGMLIVTVLIAMIRYRSTPPGLARQQMKFAMLGFAVVMVLAVTSFLIGHLMDQVGIEARRWMGLLTTFTDAGQAVAFSLGLLVSLLRYRLYDADAVISRSAAYAFLTILLGAIFAGSEKVIEVLGEEFFGEGSRALAAGLGAAIAAIMIAPLHERVRNWTEKRFQRALSRLRSSLPRTVSDMREYASLDHLLSTVAGQIEKGVRATRAAILLNDGGGPLAAALTRHISQPEVEAWRDGWTAGAGATLDCDRDDALFPLRMRLHADGAGTIGWILLGPRPDGSFYGKDEREALAELADPIARAIHIVRQRSAREAHIFSHIHGLQSELARLVRSVARLTPDAPA
jgi:hypothetical protein